MAEEKMQAAKVLLKNPYRQVILQDYNKNGMIHVRAGNRKPFRAPDRSSIPNEEYFRIQTSFQKRFHQDFLCRMVLNTALPIQYLYTVRFPLQLDAEEEVSK